MIRLLIFPFLLLIALVSFAHEGMWIPSLLKINEGHMQSEGTRLSDGDIYSVNNSSLKDAIVLFGGGCTAEVISGQGLILTNHHCGFGAIRSHSSVENDLLKNGFWAEDHSKELMNENITATFVVRIEDVTERVLSGIEGEAVDRNSVIEENIKVIIDELEEENGYKGSVKPFFYGNEYYLIVTKTYSDVRLVGAPPSSIGKYGGDTDNWMWPRHNADFSLFRIYANTENEPAEPSEENVPYKPKKSLKISISGAQEGDFAMVYGFPARTSTYIPSFAVEHVVDRSNPAKIDMRSRTLMVLDPAMNGDPAIKIQYASKQSGISNAYKKWIGQNNGLKELYAVQKKMDLEKEMMSRIGSTEALSEQYRGILSNLQEDFKTYNDLSFAREVFIEMVFYGPDIIRFARRFDALANNYDKLKESGELAETIAKLKTGSVQFFEGHNIELEKKMFDALFPVYLEYCEGSFAPDVASSVKNKYKNDAAKYSEELFEKTMFTDPVKIEVMLDKFSSRKAKKIIKDPLFHFQADLFDTYLAKVRTEYGSSRDAVDEHMRIYLKAMMEIFPDAVYWSDANSTLRLSYGKVEGSVPRDGMSYRYYTTLAGVVQKYVPGDPEFDLPERLIELLENKEFGQYADADGTLHVCFTSSLHTTGGNSGSPILNGNGELIGLNFDRSWESTMSDLMFDPDRCRNISVDIRYVLFIIDEFAGADHLINEMELVRSDALPDGATDEGTEAEIQKEIDM